MRNIDNRYNARLNRIQYKRTKYKTTLGLIEYSIEEL